MNPALPPLPSTSFQYSEQGVSLARSLLSDADTQAAAEKPDTLLSGLDQIEKSPATTADEKALARIIIPMKIEGEIPWLRRSGLSHDSRQP